MCGADRGEAGNTCVWGKVAVQSAGTHKAYVLREVKAKGRREWDARARGHHLSPRGSNGGKGRGGG